MIKAFGIFLIIIAAADCSPAAHAGSSSMECEAIPASEGMGWQRCHNDEATCFVRNESLSCFKN